MKEINEAIGAVEQWLSDCGMSDHIVKALRLLSAKVAALEQRQRAYVAVSADGDVFYGEVHGRLEPAPAEAT